MRFLPGLMCVMGVCAARAADDGNTALLSLDAGQQPVWGAARPGWEVAPSTPAQQVLTWPDFIAEVMVANLDYAAARYDVDMAAADAAAARLLPNPHLSVAGDRDLSFRNKYGTGSDGQTALLRQVETRSIGIDQTIETGGKRKLRTRVADQALRSAAATLDDFLRNLRLDAASAFVDALAAQESVERLRMAEAFLTQLVHAQERRYAAGDIGKPDLTQAQLEAARFHNDLVQAEAGAAAARVALVTFLGRDRGQTDFTVEGSLAVPVGEHDLARIIAETLQLRPDLIALRHARDAADSGIELAKAQRIPDLDVSLAYTHNDGVALNHPIDPSPAWNQATLGLSFPIPVFDRYQNQVRKAHDAAAQAQVRLSAAELHAQADVRGAEVQYRAARQRLEDFRGGLLSAADSLLEAKRFSYQRGAATLLELLEAQRSDNDLRQDYEQATADLAQAAIAFERATGIDQQVKF